MIQKRLLVGEVIRDMRTRVGMTQRTIAERTGIDYRTVAAIEKGQIQTPSLDKLQKISSALNINMKDLFGQAEALGSFTFISGTPKGEFLLEYPRQKFRILSYLPKNAPLFSGKLILDNKGQITSSFLPFRTTVFMQIILGKIRFILEGKETVLKEGQNLLFDGKLEYQIQNILLRESTALLVTVPSFLNAGKGIS